MNNERFLFQELKVLKEFFSDPSNLPEDSLSPSSVQEYSRSTPNTPGTLGVLYSQPLRYTVSSTQDSLPTPQVHQEYSTPNQPPRYTRSTLLPTPQGTQVLHS